MRIIAYRVPQAPVLDIVWRRFDVAAVALSLTGVRAAVFKVVCDQTLLSPYFNVIFYSSQALLEGGSLGEAATRARHGFWPTWLASLQFYGCVHLITFGVLPPHLRIAWNSCAAIAWTAFMSHQNQTLKRHSPDRVVESTASDSDPPVSCDCEPCRTDWRPALVVRVMYNEHETRVTA